ncbi:MAG: beta-L-arabinofuranosidase domain-containing protein [Eubacterium ramulus]
MELVRNKVIPYQWSALNDDVEDAAPSYCMHNFKVAAKRNDQKRKEGKKFHEPKFSYRGFGIWPEDPKNPKDEFYGMAFQDSDFYKWVEAVAYSLTPYPDPELEQKADDAINIVCAAQEENGYLDTYYILNGLDQIFTNLKDFHELYCLGHLIEGAVAYYQGDRKG